MPRTVVVGVAMAGLLMSACGRDATVSDDGSSTSSSTSSSAVPVSSGDQGPITVVDVTAGTTTKVTLGIFSGLPDPTWTLTAEQSNQLSALLAGLRRADGVAPMGGLGYHGFTIVGVDGTFVAFQGIVSHTSDPAYLLVDPQRSAEQFLLDTGRSHLTSEEIAAVNETLAESGTS